MRHCKASFWPVFGVLTYDLYAEHRPEQDSGCSRTALYRAIVLSVFGRRKAAMSCHKRGATAAPRAQTPLTFEALMAEHMRGFQRRAWSLVDWQAWLANPKRWRSSRPAAEFDFEMVLGPETPQRVFQQCQLSHLEMSERSLPARFGRSGVFRVAAELFDLPEDRMTIPAIRREYQLRNLAQPRWEHVLYFCRRNPDAQVRCAWIPLLRKADCVPHGVSTEQFPCLPCFTTRLGRVTAPSQRVVELHPLGDMVYGPGYLFLGIRSEERIVVNPIP